MATPAELREQARLYRLAVEDESTPAIKVRLASHAFALAQLAEAIERRARYQRVDGFASAAAAERHRRGLLRALYGEQRKPIEMPADEELADPAASGGPMAD